MIARLGVFQTIAIVAVALGIGGWVVYTQTDLLGSEDAPVPAVSPADDPVAVKQEDEPVQTEETAEAEAEETVSQEETETENEQASEEEATDEETVVEEPAVSAPTFDVVRVESDGTAVVAGSGPAGWDITILVDGVDIVTVPSDASGQFVAFLDLGKSDQARVMTLRATDNQRIVLSSAQVIIAPVETRVAEAEVPEAEVETPEAEVEVASSDAETEDTVPVEETSEATDQEQADQEQAEVAVDSEATDTEVTEDAASNDDQPQSNEGQETDDEVVVAVLEETTESETSDTPEVSSSEESADTSDQVAVVAETTEVETTTSASEDTTTSVEAATPTISTSDSDGAEAETEVTASEDEVTETTDAPDQDVAPAVLLVDDDGVNVLQPADTSPEALDQLSIAAITYSEDGAVFLTGFSPSGFLRVYLNNKQVIILEVPEPGEWKAELVDVAPGIYTLRVDQVDEDGQVVQRVETPFKREEPEKVVEVAQTRKPLVSLEVVQPGSTLWAISRETYGSGVLFVRIFEANRDQIRNPDLIYPGQIFELPAPPGAKKKKRASGE